MDLRQSLDSPEESKAALNAAAAEFCEGHPTRCKIVVEGDTQKLRTRVKDEVYRIGREAMLNGFTHAQATLVEVRTVYANDALRVRVHDDGKGIDATTLAFQTRPGLGVCTACTNALTSCAEHSNSAANPAQARQLN
jgi:signal transduction histidine kinase